MAPAPGRVLVVDDDPAVAETLVDILGDEGYAVATAVDGAALEAALADPPALVLLDVLMPSMDGPEVCRRLKADPRTAGVPVVFLTAVGDTALAARLGDCAHDGVLHKPFALAELLAVVHRHLGA
jgi:DNA-binding response OmpR family regulator